MDATALPAGSYWHHEARIARGPAAEPPRSCRIAIVGGGLAGLATAIAIKELRPSAEVVVLEREFCGFGASGRNGGLLSPLAAPIWLVTADGHAEHAAALRSLNAATADAARRIAAEMPEAEARALPLRIEAAGPLTSAALERIARTLDRLRIASALSRAPRHRRRNALEITGHAVQPYRLVLGLAAKARRLGVLICEDVRVTGIREAVSGVEIGITGRPAMTAATVVVCTNAYTRDIALAKPPAARTIFNYMIATAPIQASDLSTVGNREKFTVELNLAYVFWRLHQGRVVLGGIDRLRHKLAEFDVPADIRTKLARLAAASLGDVPTPPVEHAWGGRYHATHTELPIIGRAPGSRAIVYNVGYGGTGVALTQVLAPVAAALALDEPVADPELAHLAAAMHSTRLPLVAAGNAGLAIAWAAARNLVRG